ncbi:hypothetical protein ACS0TY_007020 [Phlomoides rotata]
MMALEGNFIKLLNCTSFHHFHFVFSKFPNADLFWLMVLRIWTAGVCTHVLDGHSDPVTSICNLMPKGMTRSIEKIDIHRQLYHYICSR